MKRPLRIGVFGLLGSGNLGNDGSLEAVLAHLRTEYPDARLGALVGGPEIVRERYGLDATPLHWNQAEYKTASGARSIALKGFGKLVDTSCIPFCRVYGRSREQWNSLGESYRHYVQLMPQARA